MFKELLQAVCIACGGVCDYTAMLCEDCLEKLEEPKHRCLGCGHPLAVDAYHCRHCDEKARGIDYYYSDFLYTGPLRTLIYKIKYEWYFRGAGQLGLLSRVDSELLDAYDMIVPVPYHFFRRFVRFLQPVDILAKELAGRTDAPVCKAVKRLVNTEYQSRLRSKARQGNVVGVFGLVENVRNKEILVIDDVVTTGATVKEIAELLKRNGAARVDVYSLMTSVPR